MNRYPFAYTLYRTPAFYAWNKGNCYPCSVDWKRMP